ncbi:MAG: MarR family transcriptional regulator [Candidatus Zixiibacteriota bacterium]
MDKKANLMEGIGRTWLLLKRYGRKMISEMNMGLTFDQMLVLFALEKNEGMKIGDIAELTDRDRTTTSRMISGLERKNYLLRVASREDNRQKLIYLTQAGRDILDGLAPMKEDFIKILFKGISTADIEKTAEIVFKVAKNLEEF